MQILMYHYFSFSLWYYSFKFWYIILKYYSDSNNIVKFNIQFVIFTYS